MTPSTAIALGPRRSVARYFVEYGGQSYPVGSLREASQRWLRYRAYTRDDSLRQAIAFVRACDGTRVGWVAFDGRVYAGDAREWTFDTRVLYDHRPGFAPI
ncbi:MAG: hypothetical protein ACYDHY_18375 [Acidiferrobacterales bacterium]